MGGFLSMSGVIGCASESAVVAALRTFAEAHQGSLDQAASACSDDNCLVISVSDGGVSVVYPWGFNDWDDASVHLCKQLKKPVFSLHIHDGDLWMYVLRDQIGRAHV